MKTLLVYAPFSPLIIGKGNLAMHIPLSLASISAYLKSKGHDCSVIDFNIKAFKYLDTETRKLWHEKNRMLWENPEIFERETWHQVKHFEQRWVDTILSHKPDIVGFYICCSTEPIAKKLAEDIKKKSNAKIMFGGPGCFHENIHRFTMADAVVLGEGELTSEELVRNGVKPCKGAYVNGSYGGDREYIEDLDTLPYPDFSDVIEDYRSMLGENLWLSTSWIRGCPGKCHFCYDRIFWKSPRMRTAKSIVDELEYQKDKYNAYKFHKNDSALTLNPKVLNEICDEIIKRGLNIDWYSQARPDAYLTKELLTKMRKSGCTGLMFGVESGSQKVINHMGKALNLKVTQRIIRDCKELGIGVGVTLMVNEPSETWFDYVKTIIFLLKNRKNIAYYNTSSAGIMPMIDWEREPEKYGFKITKTLRNNGYFMFDYPNFGIGTMKRDFMQSLKVLVG